MADVIPNKGKGSILNQEFDWSGNTYHMVLLTSSHTNNIDTQQFLSDINTNEVSGTGYTANGKVLASLAVTVDNTNDRASLDFADVTWASSTITARYAAVVEWTGNTATSKIVGINDFTTDKSSSNEDFIYQTNTDGYLRLS